MEIPGGDEFPDQLSKDTTATNELTGGGTFTSAFILCPPLVLFLALLIIEII